VTEERPSGGSSAAGISRRTARKRIGAGAAIAWTAPVLTSLRTPAFAASPACITFDCKDMCPKPSACGPPCACGPFITVNDDCFCANLFLTTMTTVCAKDSDCPPFPGLKGRCVLAKNCVPFHMCAYCGTVEDHKRAKGLKRLG
jgi:hypothetical protein